MPAFSTSTSASASVAPSDAAVATIPTASIALKVRTLDQKTYPIVVATNASVPQLKEAVASETGVVLARQRLIFRGKVLKNDQSIGAYALEDGHVLHLVVRAEDAVATAPNVQDEGQSPTTTRNRSAQVSPPMPRNNDDPDPTVGLSSRPRMVMGATIAVPDDMPMPFLNSVITNFVNSMGSAAAGAAGGNNATGGAAVSGDDPQRTQRNQRDMLRRLRRARRTVEHATGERPSGGSSRRRGRESGDGSAGGVMGSDSMSFTSSLSGNMLRDAAANQLSRLETSLANSEFDIPDVQARDEPDAATTADVNRDDEIVQNQLTQLRTHMDRFGPRMDRLPAALREIAWYARHHQEAPHAIVSSTVRAIDTLQNVGDSAATIARFARHVFLANSPDIPAPMVRIDDRGTLRASLSFPMMGGTGGPVLPGALPRTPVERQQTRGLMPLPRPTPAADMNSSNETATADTRGSPSVLRSLYQRVTSGLLGSRTNDGRADTEVAAATALPTNPGSPAVLHPDEPSEGGMNRFTISALSGQYHPIFPMSFPSGGGLFPPPVQTTRRPEWDVAGLWQRLAQDLRAATAFGVLRGDPVAVYDLMRSLASIFVAGAYTPSLTSTPIRVWARRFLIAVRRVLSEITIPPEVLELTPDRSASRLVEELTRPLDPFMPELVDHIRRSNSASQGDVFGRNCTDFFRNLATQFVTRVRTYANEDDAQATRLLEGILVSLEVDAGLATYIIDRLLALVSPTTPARRFRDAEAEAAADADAPTVKRPRRE